MQLLMEEIIGNSSLWQNLITEKIAEILVNFKGPASPFGIPFANAVHYNITKQFNLPQSPQISPLHAQTS